MASSTKQRKVSNEMRARQRWKLARLRDLRRQRSLQGCIARGVKYDEKKFKKAERDYWAQVRKMYPPLVAAS